MTRYARAKGSKASNERLPNEATPWSVMKQQLEDKNNESLEKKKSAKELLKDYQESNTHENTSWAEFEENRSKKKEKKKSAEESLKRHERNTVDNIANTDSNSHFTKHEKTCEKREYKKSKSKKLCTKKTNGIERSENNDTVVSKSDNIKENLQQTHIEDTKTEETDSKTEKFSKKRKRKEDFKDLPSKKKSKQDEAESNFTVLTKRQKRNLKRKLKTTNDNTPDKISNYKGKEKKSKQEGTYKRRKPDVGATKMVINGIEIEIVKYDGFPVKKEDAERLVDLKQQMIMKGKYNCYNCVYIINIISNNNNKLISNFKN